MKQRIDDRSNNRFARCLAGVAMLRYLPVAHGGSGPQWEVFEASYESTQAYPNAFTAVEVDVVFKQGDQQWKVPAFWAGDKQWTVRFAPPTQGEFTYRVECTDKTNPGLNGNEQTLSLGFSVVQMVCGPYPDENFFAPSLANEGGQPYLADDLSVVNPKYFDYADRRFKHLVDSGMVPAIVGAWGRGDCNSMEKARSTISSLVGEIEFAHETSF